MSDQKPRRVVHVFVVALLVLVIAYAGIRPALQWYFPLKYYDTVTVHAERHRIDPLLIAAIMRVESDFDPNAVSAKGARGLMQLMPETAQWAAEQMGLSDFSVDRLFEPELNVEIGVWYFATLRRLFEGDTVLALAAYNGGRSNVLRWLDEKSWSGHVETVEDIPFPETRSYVQKVLNAYRWYQRVYRKSSPDFWSREPAFSHAIRFSPTS